jgi:RNA 3'-terminal phosphate cyclase (ATP)
MKLLEIDGSQGEGGGQILRTSVSLSCILGIPIRIRNIRAGRKEPGLRPQHLQAVMSAAEISNARTTGTKVGSLEIEFYPGEPMKQVSKTIETGTAGSVTLIAQTLIPIGIFCNSGLDLQILGGTEVPASPTIDYLQKILLPIYQEIGGNVQIDLIKRGYYPKGGGIIRVRTHGSSNKVHALKFNSSWSENLPVSVSIIASSSLLPSHVTQREIDAARKELLKNGIKVEDATVDSSDQALSPGTSVLIFRRSNSEFIGASALGELGKKAEQVGVEAAHKFLREIDGRPNVDSHLADMLVTLSSCIPEETSFTTSRVTKHLETNIQVAQKFTGRTFRISKVSERRIYSVETVSHGEKPI